jgi:hypothetical protein
MSGCFRSGVVRGFGAVISTRGRVFVHVCLVVTLSDVIDLHVSTADSSSVSMVVCYVMVTRVSCHQSTVLC